MARAGRPRPDALLGGDTVSARLLSHPAVLLGGPRALLMQVAHPKVAAGVVDHSGFTSEPFARLVRTLRAMDGIAFGSPARAARILRSLEARHRRVTGTTSAGEEYAALDPVLGLWVHATLVDTALAVDRRFLGMLGEPERSRFYDESRLLARAFGIPDDLVPPDLGAFTAYIQEMVATVEVGTEARAVARQVLRPPVSGPLGRAGGVVGLLAAPLIEAVTADLLPAALRRAYGLRRAPAVVPGWGLPGPAGAATEGAAAVALGLAAALSRGLAPRLTGLSRL